MRETIVRPNYLALLHDLEETKNRRYKWSELGDRLGMTGQAAKNLFTAGSADGYLKFKTAGAMIDFFRAEGVNVTLDDLIVVDRRPE